MAQYDSDVVETPGQIEMSELSIEQAVQLAMQKHRAGNLAEAEAIYRRVLPLVPGNIEIYINFGLVLAQQGRLVEAAAAFSQAIALRPDFAQAHAFLGSALRELGRFNEALAACSRAVQLKGDFAEAYVELGNVFCHLGKFDDAAAAFGRAVQLKPDMAPAHNNLADALFRLGRLDEALASCNKAVQLQRDFAEAHNNRGAILHEKGQLDDAIAAYRTAIQLKPDYALAHNNLGNLLCKKQQYGAAIAAYRRAIELKPNDAAAYSDLATALYKTNNLDPAIEHYQHAIRINPHFAQAHCFMAQALLLKGDLQNGWREFEWRWNVKPLKAPRPFTQPRWSGGNLNGQTILLYSEQGFGDVFQFARYVPIVAEKGGRIILECRSELQRILEQSGMAPRFVINGSPLPEFDCQCPLESLPMAFGTELPSIPANVPYLNAAPELVKKWRERFGPDDRRKKVGLVWAGNPDNDNDSDRSISLKQFAPLAGADGVDFFSLQKGHPGKQAPPPSMRWTDWTNDLFDFADTAALLANLDLLITVDTAVAHLAGAMGKPVWLLLPFSPGWRWLLNRDDSPWYPTARLFRQKTPGDFSDPLSRIVAALKDGNFGVAPFGQM
jgi:tetratricopeptide (TPR) repeat protein